MNKLDSLQHRIKELKDTKNIFHFGLYGVSFLSIIADTHYSQENQIQFFTVLSSFFILVYGVGRISREIETTRDQINELMQSRQMYIEY